MKAKHPLEIARDERAKLDPCSKCGFNNRDPDTKFHFYEETCKNCGAGMDHSYLWAPFGYSWEYLQETQDRMKEILDKYRSKNE